MSSKKKPASASRVIIFRSLIIVVVGFFGAGTLLDWGLNRAQGSTQYRQWMESNFKLIEAQLETSSPIEWPAVVQRLSKNIDMPILVVPLEHVIGRNPEEAMQPAVNYVTYTDEYDRLIHVAQLHLDQGDFTVRIDPNDGGFKSGWAKIYATPVYFFLMTLLVWLWIRPFVRDVRMLDKAATRLADNYNQPIPELEQVATLRVLASTFQVMRVRLKNLIDGQKEMTNALSHELRTPLARIKFGLALIEGKVQNEIKSDLAYIHEDLAEVDRLIAMVLDYASYDRQALNPTLEEVNLRRWLSQIVERNRFSERGIECELIINKPRGVKVVCDPTIMSIAVSNLISNTLRYAEKKTRISLEQRGKNWRILVEDDGPGIPPEMREKVLKPFVRLDESRDKSSGGFGLGLSIVARIASVHFGSISIHDSDLGGVGVAITWRVHKLARSSVNQNGKELSPPLD